MAGPRFREVRPMVNGQFTGSTAHDPKMCEVGLILCIKTGETWQSLS